jgi:hypothetical protein
MPILPVRVQILKLKMLNFTGHFVTGLYKPLMVVNHSGSGFRRNYQVAPTQNAGIPSLNLSVLPGFQPLAAGFR